MDPGTVVMKQSSRYLCCGDTAGKVQQDPGYACVQCNPDKTVWLYATDVHILPITEYGRTQISGERSPSSTPPPHSFM